MSAIIIIILCVPRLSVKADLVEPKLKRYEFA